MKNVTTSIRIDSNTKQAATELLNELGLDLQQCSKYFFETGCLARRITISSKISSI